MSAAAGYLETRTIGLLGAGRTRGLLENRTNLAAPILAPNDPEFGQCQIMGRLFGDYGMTDQWLFKSETYDN